LIEIPLSRFRVLKGEDLEGVLAWRTRKAVLGVERTVVVTFNPELFLTQTATILREVQSRTRKLGELRAHLAHPAKKGKAITRQSAEKQVQAILSGRHLKDLLRVQVTEKKRVLRLTYRFDRTAWARLQRTLLGKNIIFTDQDSWSEEEIVRAYRGQYHIEEAFKRMKNPHFVSWRPLHHWTDQKIRVHAFYCVLALLLSSLLRRRLVAKGIDLSIVKILATLSEIKEVALYYRGAASQPVIDLNEVTPQQERLLEVLNLRRHLESVGHTEASL
jgi:transposase